MLDIETVALPVSQHRGVNLHVLQQARLVVIAHGVHERAFARHAVVIQLVRDKRGLVRTTVHSKIEDLVLAILNGFVKHDPVAQQKLTFAGGAPCKGARCFLKQQVRAIAFKRHIARAQHIVKPRIPRLQRIRIRAKGQNVAVLALKGIYDHTARIGRKSVVGIQERDDRRRGRSDTRIARARQAAVLLIDQRKARVLFAIGSRNIARTVRRAIVDQHAFPIGHVLCKQGVQAPGQALLHVIDGNDNGNLGGSHSHSLLLCCRNVVRVRVVAVGALIRQHAPDQR